MRTRRTSAPIAELGAVDAALAGEQVGEGLEAVGELALSLRATRPVPRHEFALMLDERLETDFRPGAEGARALPARLRPRLLSLRMPRRITPLAVGTLASLFIVVTGVVSSGLLSGGGGDQTAPPSPAGTLESRGDEAAPAPGKAGGAPRTAASPQAVTTAPAPSLPERDTAAGARRRKVERSAALVLSTPPDEIEDVADSAIRVTDRYGGFVMRSSVSSGAGQAAGATLDLRIPSNRLQPALADLSELAHVRSRTQGSQDITALFGSPRRRLADAVAERRALLRQLAKAATPNETTSIRVRLRLAERRIDRARRALRRLDTRVGLAAVSVTVEPGSERDAGGWTPGDALRDALAVLRAVLGALIISLAVAIPLGLALLVGWRARRAYLRQARERALESASRG